MTFGKTLKGQAIRSPQMGPTLPRESMRAVSKQTIALRPAAKKSKAKGTVKLASRGPGTQKTQQKVHFYQH